MLNHTFGAGWMFTLVNEGRPVGEDAGDVLGDDPQGALAELAPANVAAWRAPGALEGERTYHFGTFPAPVALMVNVGEIAVHAWDLAGQPPSIPNWCKAWEEQPMTLTNVNQTTQARLNAILDDVQRALVEIITEHRVTQEEFRAATQFLAEAGQQHLEIPLMLDVFLATAVDDVTHAREGTECNVEGPVYFAGAPVLERPYVLPRRTDEPGEKLMFSGTVRSTDGSPLAGATLDVWQANGAAEYSHFNPDVPEYNLRGKLKTDDTGAFEFETVVPSPYEVPTGGATGRLLAALGRSAFRPGHIHFKISHEDAYPLTTQIYFEGDPWIDADVVGAVKASLITKLARYDDASGNSYATCSYDFVLPVAGPDESA